MILGLSPYSLENLYQNHKLNLSDRKLCSRVGNFSVPGTKSSLPDEAMLEQPEGEDIILSNPVADSEEHLGLLKMPLKLQSFIDLQKSLGITKNRLGDSNLSSEFNLVGEVGTEKETAESFDSPELCLSFSLSSSSLLSSLSRASTEVFFITLWPF